MDGFMRGQRYGGKREKKGKKLWVNLKRNAWMEEVPLLCYSRQTQKRNAMQDFEPTWDQVCGVVCEYQKLK